MGALQEQCVHLATEPSLQPVIGFRNIYFIFMCMYVCIIYMHHVYAAAHRGQRVLDPLGGIREGFEMPDVSAGYGTWVWNLALSKSCDWN